MLIRVLIGVSSVYVSFSRVFEWDIKKVVALSTIGHIGLVMGGVSGGDLVGSFFHLLCHAVCKSLLFLCLGVVIHEYGFQDLRFIRGVRLKLPIIRRLMSVSVMRLSGIPFIIGSYSKDLLIIRLLDREVGFVSFLLSLRSFSSRVGYGIRLLESLWAQRKLGSIYVVKRQVRALVPCSILGTITLVGGILMGSLFLDEGGSGCFGEVALSIIPLAVLTRGLRVFGVVSYGYSSFREEGRLGGLHMRVGRVIKDSVKRF